ncbi:MAG: PAS domain S-box protein [Janthinobacterium lividum]
MPEISRYEAAAAPGADAVSDAAANASDAAADAAGPAAVAGRAEQRRLEGIIRFATEAIITVDDAQTILLFNPMAEKLLQCAASDAIGTSLERFIPARYRAAHAQQVTQFGITGITERQMGPQRPLFGLRADGVEFPIEASISQFVDGGARLYTVMMRDITARLRAEAELNASRNELRELSASIQTAREAEKAHIARELHDDLGQRLTALKMDVSRLESELDERDVTGDWRERTRAMQRLIDDTVMAVRGIAADLRPVMLDDLGLVAAVEWLAHEWRTRHGIVVRLEGNEVAVQVEHEAATTIYRIVQEALTNVVRHANATRVTVSLIREGAAYIVRIADNGVGRGAATTPPATSATPATRQSFGLIGMRERARLLDGEIAFDSPAHGGFVVTATLPIAMIARADAAPTANPIPDETRN